VRSTKEPVSHKDGNTKQVPLEKIAPITNTVSDKAQTLADVTRAVSDKGHTPADAQKPAPERVGSEKSGWGGDRTEKSARRLSSTPIGTDRRSSMVLQPSPSPVSNTVSSASESSQSETDPPPMNLIISEHHDPASVLTRKDPRSKLKKKGSFKNSI